MPLTAEIVTIGDEILIGQVVDTNSAWLGEQLNTIGVAVARIVSISDRREAILSAVGDALSRADLVILTGGLGPTRDDITKHALCEYFGCALRQHPGIEAHIARLFAGFGRELTEVNRLQAALPEDCEPLPNSRGTAPGMWFDTGGKVLVSLPGVPYEMKGIVLEQMMPRLVQRHSLPAISHRTLLTTGMGESMIAERIAAWEDALPDGLRLAYLPSPGLVRLRLTAAGDDSGHIAKLLSEQGDTLRALLSGLVFGEGNDTLEGVVGRMLADRGRTVCTAESCTAGAVAHRLATMPGASAYFLGGIVSYHNNLKKNQLGVSIATLERHGAVSEATVLEMAIGAKERLGADYAVAVSGIAGPSGGTEEKPVGTVWIAVAGPSGCSAKRFQFGDERLRNMERSTIAAINMLRLRLLADA